MKKVLIFAFISILSLSVLPQEIFIEDSLVINVEVPVRVYEGRTFIDNLTIDDFQVFEDGVPQKIEAVYLIKKKSIERKEENKRFVPQTSRNFFLFFEISDYTKKLGESIDYFIHNVFLPGDNLFISTPLKTYKLKEIVLELRSKEEIAKEIKELLRKDTITGSSEYNSIIRDLTQITRALTAEIMGPKEYKSDEATSSLYDMKTGQEEAKIEELLMLYAGNLSRLETLRDVDQLQLLDFARFLKYKEGQKYVFLFYQREFLPQIDPKILGRYSGEFQDRPTIQMGFSDLYGLLRRDISFNVDLIKQAYADSSVSIHFLFISTPTKDIYGIRMQEQSEDIYQAFKEMARATGGFVDSSANPVYLFQNALQASENYYLIYYIPKNYIADGKFKELKVEVKDKKYRITHRSGYNAD
ncbi:MAG: hypothetical protein V3S65_07985 [Candidatus Aminicenantaceae bacterium]